MDKVSRKCVPEEPAEIASIALTIRTALSRSVVKTILALVDMFIPEYIYWFG
jgi:hypothetical protein